MTLAVKPKDSDTFIREVDEELRRDRVNDFMTRYGWQLIGGVVLLLVAVGGYIWWQNHREGQAGAASEKLIEVIEQVDANNARAAAPGIDELAANSRDGYRYGALFMRANAQIATGAMPAAVATLRSIAEDGEAPQQFRDAATIRLIQLEFDTLTPVQAIERLRPYAQPGQPWFGTAGELIGIAYLRAGRPERAAPVFEAVARDPQVPESIRVRVIQMASSLGIDAVEFDPSLNSQSQANAVAAAAAAAQAAPGPAPAPPPPPGGANQQGNEAARAQ